MPHLRDVRTDRLLSGHLWLQEWIDGRHCRFRLQESGVLEVSDGERTFRQSDVPPASQATIRHLREHIDRDALRTAVDDVEAVVFLGIATVRNRIAYDWDRIPPFLGYDVWLVDESRFLPPDRVEAIYKGLMLTPINAFRKEVRAVDFDPDDYAFPDSKWYDGPVAGVVVRNKTGDRALLGNPTVEGEGGAEAAAAQSAAEVTDSELEPAELADEVTTDRRIDRAREGIETSGGRSTPEALVERVLEGIYREEGHLIEHLEEDERRAFRTAVAAAVRRSFEDGG